MKKKDTIRYLISEIRDIYSGEEAKSIAHMVLEYLGFSRRELVLRGDEELDDRLLPELKKISDELKRKKPVQYVLGLADFYGLKFRVNEHVLIPRAETEEMVDLLIKENNISCPRIVDIGTGSGCIAISLGKYIKGSVLTATDISSESLAVAMHNAMQNDVRIDFIKDDIFNTLLQEQKHFDILVSNPPYVTESEKLWMHQNVIDYEPGLALFVPDSDPLKYYYKIAELGSQVLKHDGKLYVEINERFAEGTVMIFEKEGYEEIQVVKDLRGKDRIVKAVRA